LAAVVEELGGRAPELLAGYRVKILDGNALAGTDHRIPSTKENRRVQQGMGKDQVR
jgi:isochorismate synthase EntC